MFRRLREPTRRVRLTLDGRSVEAGVADSVAAVLLAEGVSALRRTVRTARPRGVYCGMGACFDCLITIDGEANRQACLTVVREGMTVETGGGAPRLRTSSAVAT